MKHQDTSGQIRKHKDTTNTNKET